MQEAADPPCCEVVCNRGSSVGVQRLCLLQQHTLHQPGDVQVDVACEVVHAGCVGSYPCQQVRGTCYFLGGLVVIGHLDDDSGETCLNSVTCQHADSSQMGS